MKTKYFIVFCLFCSFYTPAWPQSISWQHLSTDRASEIPLPWKATEQTGALVADLDKDGVNDFVLSCRKTAPALVWYQRKKDGWARYVIEDQMLTIEAGGAAYDIDGDGDLDLVFGGDWQSSSLWWWENPYPQMNFHWKRHVIKSEGATQHHDQLIGHFKHSDKTQLVFWNQGNKSLYLADMPADPKKDNWEYRSIFRGGDQHSPYVEGLAAGDIDGDGYPDIVAGNNWLRYDPASGNFVATQFAEAAGRVAVGKFKPGKTMQIVVSPGDGEGPVTWYESIGDPGNPKSWIGHDLGKRAFIHAHSLQVADINGDGYADIFVAEMMKWTESRPDPDNPHAESLIFWGDGKGGFTRSTFQKGFDFHEAQLADLDGDGDLDVLCKPYNYRAPRIDSWLQNGTGKPMTSLRNIIPEKIGLELYSFRASLANDLAGTIKTVHDLGFQEVEVSGYYGQTPEKIKELLRSNHLKPTSMLFPYERFRDSLDKIIAEARLMGVSLVGCAWIPHQQRFTPEDAAGAIALFNEAGEKLKQQGLHFFYHPHGYEFEPLPEGGTLFDRMAGGMKTGVADFQLDVFWAWHGGADPVMLLKAWRGRFVSLHLKAMRWGEPTGVYTGHAPDEASVPLGQGAIDMKAVLQTALDTGVTHFYIEDEAPNALDQVKESLRWLSSLGLK